MAARKKQKNKSLSHYDIFITIGIVFLFGFFFLFNVFSGLDLKVYDLMLRIKPDTPRCQSVLLVNIDDLALEMIGVWPWSRSIMADILIRMKELGASQIVVDIEYLSPAPPGINYSFINELTGEFESLKTGLSQQIDTLTGAIGQGELSPESAPESGRKLVAHMSPLFDELSNAIFSGIFQNTDDYFGKAIRFAGDVYLTINASQVNRISDEVLENFAVERFLLHPEEVNDPSGTIQADTLSYYRKQRIAPGIGPAIYPVLEHARGAGFTNIVVDPDGSRRRVGLLYEYKGNYVCQLVLAPLLDIFDTRSVARTRSSLVIRNALVPGESFRRNITIPLDENGNMLINWLPVTYIESFRYQSIYFLSSIDYIEEGLIRCLQALSDIRIYDADGKALAYCDMAESLLNHYTELTTWKARLLEGERTDYDAYFSERSVFFAETGRLLAPDFEKEVTDIVETYTGGAALLQVFEYAADTFRLFREWYEAYQMDFQELQDIYNGSFCLIGNNASGTTDLGVMPFSEAYPGVGIHANVFNTIMLEQFIIPVNGRIAFATAVILALLWTLFSRRRSMLVQNVSGGTGIFLFLIIPFLLFMVFRLYTPFLAPAIMLFIIFLFQAAFRFALSEKDKRFLRRAFSTYLSPELVNEIVADPGKLSLGGEEKRITALFSDIKSFSTLSEKVTPKQLVAILNEYLTLLTDRVIENKGTVDKYIGDAIVAFFGAPITSADHAWLACISAVRMKQVEADLNRTLLQSGGSPMPLLTRIGLNTGDMVVGNMGTEMKMNYTMMGNDVNLAARLEGVNKVYGTWILVSESTWREADSGEHKGTLVSRRLDRVRVVGIEQPVQLYNILGIRDELSSRDIRMADSFNKVMDLYLKGKFTEAKTGFTDILENFPEDAASRVFAERCGEFLLSGTPENWDGVINLTNK
ncbi:CHASE2 domain-containing protein [Brucepastera parasyntrophica]|uniref:CHASE2 domain-containing protein n=1 Tax=Brucepastera parasyntrophica TaxID=2880008 RepID=UPI00210ACECA|nr:CHASE2 domain-containing protein [Brucepastera parasyntrophica]ULQ60994.1 CHASE2 domain-containing protein [Brucepastera parasyntrophica]